MGMNTTTNRDVTSTIQTQVGARAFYMMGAYNLACLGGGAEGLQFRIRGSKKANCVRIELAADDTYSISFWKIGKLANFKKVAEVTGVYADNLRPVIADKTGLMLSL